MNEKIRCTGLNPDLINNKINIRMSWQRLGRNTYTMGGKGKTLYQVNKEYECMTTQQAIQELKHHRNGK